MGCSGEVGEHGAGSLHPVASMLEGAEREGTSPVRPSGMLALPLMLILKEVIITLVNHF